MSLTLRLYKMTCEQIRVNKTSYLTQVAELTGNLREPSDLINPSITIEYSGLPKVNYAYITGFYRYYFITNITSIATNLWRLDMHEDVLMTFAGTKNALDSTGIYGLTAFVSRYEGAEADRNLIDTTYPLLGNATRKSYTPTAAGLSGWYDSSKFMKTALADDSSRYIVTFNGNVKDGTDVVIQSDLVLGHLLLTAYQLKALMEQLQSQTVAAGQPTAYYIQSVKCFPFNPHVKAGAQPVFIDVPGWFSDIGAPVNSAMTDELIHTTTFAVSVTPSSTVNQFKNYLPYTNITLTFAPFGRFALDNSLVFANASAAKTVYVRVVTDIITGNANLYYGMTVSTADIYLGSANLAIDVPLMSSSYSLSNMITGVMDGVSSVGSMLSGNPAAIPGAVNGVLNMASSFDVASSGVMNGNMKIIDNGPRIDVQFHDIPDMAVSLFGRPCALNPMLGTLLGYAEIGRVHIENLSPNNSDEVATRDEQDEIEQQLMSGVIL